MSAPQNKSRDNTSSEPRGETFGDQFLQLLRGPLPMVLLLACHISLGMSAVSRKTPTFDEPAHITGGLSYWTRNDYRLQPENGNLSQRFVAIPLWLRGFKLPRFSTGWAIGDVWITSLEYLFGSAYNVDVVTIRCRWMMVLPAMLMGFLVYFWSGTLFGPYGGLLSLALFTFSPTMLANDFLTTSDLLVALFFTATIGALWKLLHRVSPGTVVLAGLALSGLCLAKFSAPLILPMAALLILVRLFNRQPLIVALGRPRDVSGVWRQLAVFAAVAIFEVFFVVCAIWVAYGFRYDAYVADVSGPGRFLISWEGILDKAPEWLIRVSDFAREHRLLPEGYLYGFTYTVRLAQERVTFLHGEFSLTGWRSFFPICFALKTPLEFFAVLGIAGWGAWAFRRRDKKQQDDTAPTRGGQLYEVAPLVVLIAVYWWFAVRSNLNIGHRHLLPTYPALFILAGAAAKWFQPRAKATVEPGSADVQQDSNASAVSSRLQKVVQAFVAVLMLLYVGEAMWIWPNYLAYFNVLAGGPRQGYRWLVDSSLDWGQDLKELQLWLAAHPDDASDPARLYVSYFGSIVPDYYEIPAQSLPNFFDRREPRVPQPLTGGVYCLSASMLNSVYIHEARGRWNEEFEEKYQKMLPTVQAYWKQAPTPEQRKELDAAASTPQMRKFFSVFEQLRLGRLNSCLRQREPDDMVGYSILIYRLSDADVERALYDKPCELLPAPETKSPPKSDDPAK